MVYVGELPTLQKYSDHDKRWLLKFSTSFFQSLYEEEERASQQLEGKAKVYLGIISAFLVTILLKTEDVVKSAAALNIPFSLILAEALFMSAALICVVLSLRIRAFDAINDGESIVESYGDEDPTDVEFFRDRIVDYAVASSRNRAVNYQISLLLSWASWLLIAGMIFLLFISTYALGRSNVRQKYFDTKSAVTCTKCSCIN